jgi:hypothetical protein
MNNHSNYSLTQLFFGGVFIIFIIYSIWVTRGIPSDADLIPGAIMEVNGEVIVEAI